MFLDLIYVLGTSGFWFWFTSKTMNTPACDIQGYACWICTCQERIQSSDAPVSDTHHQENEGDQRVQQSWHHVTDRPVEYQHTHTHRRTFVDQHWHRVSKNCTKPKQPNLAWIEDVDSEVTDLLDSWMSAMAMRILVRRKMTVRRMMASPTDTRITEVEEVRRRLDLMAILTHPPQ